ACLAGGAGNLIEPASALPHWISPWTSTSVSRRPPASGATPGAAAAPRRNGSDLVAGQHPRPANALPLNLSHPRSAACWRLRSNGTGQQFYIAAPQASQRNCFGAVVTGTSYLRCLRSKYEVSSSSLPI